MPLEKTYLRQIDLYEVGKFAKKPYFSQFCRRSKRAALNECSIYRFVLRIAGNLKKTSPSQETAKDLVKHYHNQPKERKEAGIFIYSHTYAVPDTPEERRWMTQYLYELYNNPEWRRSEAALIEDLRMECEKQKLPLYVNLSGNLQGEWKKLSPLDR